MFLSSNLKVTYNTYKRIVDIECLLRYFDKRNLRTSLVQVLNVINVNNLVKIIFVAVEICKHDKRNLMKCKNIYYCHDHTETNFMQDYYCYDHTCDDHTERILLSRSNGNFSGLFSPSTCVGIVTVNYCDRPKWNKDFMLLKGMYHLFF